jgi:rRNA-processing protein FCF1
VRFAHPGRDAADDAIVALIESHPEPSSLVVATSDRELVGRARERGADTMSAGALRRILDARGWATPPLPRRSSRGGVRTCPRPT